MTWIIIDGIDRSGKSTVAKHYESIGYEYIHFSAPNKKYYAPEPGDSTYLEDMLDFYESIDGRDIVMDRSIYGELVWPVIYDRRPLLSQYDFAQLREIERRNSTRYIYMHCLDDIEAHWQRCVDNKEPLKREQFDKAYTLYSVAATTFDFEFKTLKDISKELGMQYPPKNREEAIALGKQRAKNAQSITDSTVQSLAKSAPLEEPIFTLARPVVQINNEESASVENDAISRLEKANAINSILGSRIVKKTGGAFDQIDTEIREFLKRKLAGLFGQGSSDDFTQDEIIVLKAMAQRLKEKQGVK